MENQDKTIDELMQAVMKKVKDNVVKEDDITKIVDIDSEEYDEIILMLENEGICIATEETAEEDVDIENFDQFNGKINLEDTIKLYLKEIGQIKLLSIDEEVDLAILIEEGKKADAEMYEIEHNDMNTVSAEHYEELLDKSERGLNARNKLAESNLRLVVSIAKKFLGRGLEFNDLIQEGNLGLLKAIDKFDYTKGYKFSTYATWWIKQAVSRAICDTARTIRVPTHMVEEYNRVKKAEKLLEQRLMRDPKDAEIAEELGISEEKVIRIKRAMITPTRLDSKVGDDDDSTLGDFVADETTLTPDQKCFTNQLKEDINMIMDELLTPRERMVLEYRFGLNGKNPSTLEDIAKMPEYHLTRERIRQIESKAIRKIQKSSKAKGLVNYLY